MTSPSAKRKKKIIGYNCKVCRGRNFKESGEMILHLCEGFAEPVFETSLHKSK
jgi:hypothetical protein